MRQRNIRLIFNMQMNIEGDKMAGRRLEYQFAKDSLLSRRSISSTLMYSKR